MNNHGLYLFAHCNQQDCVSVGLVAGLEEVYHQWTGGGVEPSENWQGGCQLPCGNCIFVLLELTLCTQISFATSSFHTSLLFHHDTQIRSRLESSSLKDEADPWTPKSTRKWNPCWGWAMHQRASDKDPLLIFLYYIVNSML